MSEPLDRIKEARKEIRITSDGKIENREQYTPITLNHKDFKRLSEYKRSRGFSTDELNFSIKVPFLPVRLPHGRVSHPSKDVITKDSRSHRRWRRDGPIVGHIPLTLHGYWVFVVDKAECEGEQITVDGQVFFYIRDDQVKDSAPKLLGELERDLPAAAKRCLGSNGRSGDKDSTGISSFTRSVRLPWRWLHDLLRLK